MVEGGKGSLSRPLTAIVLVSPLGTFPITHSLSLPQINCSLHVHISYSRLAAAESGVGGAFRTGPLSSSNAPGIIIAHGEEYIATSLCT